jgi:uncharacterized membrane protein
MPSCVELGTCTPDLSNPLQWLEYYGRIAGLPPEFGIAMLMLIIVAGIYIKTGNLMLVSIGILLVVSTASFPTLSSFIGSTATLIIIAIAAILIIAIYKIKGEIF